jgi:hypothetical protein
MTCFLCRTPVATHIRRAVRSSVGPSGWARICIPCAIRHDFLQYPESGDRSGDRDIETR